MAISVACDRGRTSARHSGRLRLPFLCALAALFCENASAGAEAPTDCRVRYVYFRGILVECPSVGVLAVLNRGLDGRFRGNLACAAERPACSAPVAVVVSEEGGGYVGEGVPLACRDEGDRLICQPTR